MKLWVHFDIELLICPKIIRRIVYPPAQHPTHNGGSNTPIGVNVCNIEHVTPYFAALKQYKTNCEGLLIQIPPIPIIMIMGVVVGRGQFGYKFTAVQ